MGGEWRAERIFWKKINKFAKSGHLLHMYCVAGEGETNEVQLDADMWGKCWSRERLQG